MRKLSINEMKEISAGGLAGTVISAFNRCFSVFTDIGRYLGSSVRRIITRNYCGF